MVRSRWAIVRRFVLDESGPTATEYAVMLALVLTVIIVSVTTMGQSLSSEYTDITASCFGS